MIKMFKRGSRGIKITYDKKKVVPVTVNFKFRSGVSVQAVISSNFGSDNALNEIVILVQAPGGSKIRYGRRNIIPFTVNFKFISGVSVLTVSSSMFCNKR